MALRANGESGLSCFASNRHLVALITLSSLNALLSIRSAKGLVSFLQHFDALTNLEKYTHYGEALEKWMEALPTSEATWTAEEARR